MNAKTTKFLAVLAVLVMAFASIAVVANTEDSDATRQATAYSDIPVGSTGLKLTGAGWYK